MKPMTSRIRVPVLGLPVLFILILTSLELQSQEDALAVWRGHEAAVTDIALLPEGGSAASCSLDGTLRLWDIGSGQTREVLYTGGDEIFALAVSPDGGCILTTEYRGKARAHIREGKTSRHLAGFLGWSADIIISPGSDKAAVWSMDGDIWIWAVETGELAHRLKGKTNRWGMALAWSPNGDLLASGRSDITIWDVRSGDQVQILKGHRDFVRDLVFSPDGRWLASACMDKTVRLWDVETGEPLHVFKPKGLVIYRKSGPVTNPIDLPMTAVAFSPDGGRIATGGADRVVRLWDARSGMLLQELKGHRMSITALVFLPDGHRLLSSSLDHTIRLWDLAGE